MAAAPPPNGPINMTPIEELMAGGVPGAEPLAHVPPLDVIVLVLNGLTLEERNEVYAYIAANHAGEANWDYVEAHMRGVQVADLPWVRNLENIAFGDNWNFEQWAGQFEAAQPQAAAFVNNPANAVDPQGGGQPQPVVNPQGGVPDDPQGDPVIDPAGDPPDNPGGGDNPGEGAPPIDPD